MVALRPTTPLRSEFRSLTEDPRLIRAFEQLFDYVNSVPFFLDVPDLLDETQTDFFYFGWENVNGSWLVRRQSRTDATFQDANIFNNPIYPDLTTAWVDRYILIYS